MAFQEKDVYTCDDCGEQQEVPRGVDPKGFTGTAKDTTEGIEGQWYADRPDCIEGAVKAALDL